ncbi:MAG: WhiB family transcriptional regulator [Acidimicrobiales bacterium]
MRWVRADLALEADTSDPVGAAAELELADLLVRLAARRPAWQAQAACRGQGVDAWFGRCSPETHRRAVALCSTCVVNRECAEYALADPQLEGFWAGQSLRSRQLARRRGRTAAA